MKSFVIFPEVIIGYIIFLYVIYKFIRNKAPWQLIVLGIFILLCVVGRHMQYYYEFPRILRFYLADLSAVPMFVPFVMFGNWYVYKKTEYYKKDIFNNSFLSLIVWSFYEMYVSTETPDIYDFVAYSIGFIITIAIAFTLKEKKNYMEYITN